MPRETWYVSVSILPDTQEGTVPHQDRPAHIPRSVHANPTLTDDVPHNLTPFATIEIATTT
eukprot:2248540-Prymnesium_polylepis.1